MVLTLSLRDRHSLFLEMKRDRKGVFITTSRFSKDALEYIEMIEKN
jgi:restriction endonuclease Mrr